MLNACGSEFKARALLDSGSGTNFVAGEILHKLAYTSLKSENITISGINATETRNAALIIVTFFDKGCPVRHMKCYVIPGMISFAIDTSKY